MNGMRYDLQSIFRAMNLVYNDSSTGGYWRGAQMQHKNISMGTPLYASAPAKTMPSVVGLGLKDAVYLLENKGLRVEVKGRGRVVDQSLMAGMQINKGQKIQLLLN